MRRNSGIDRQGAGGGVSLCNTYGQSGDGTATDAKDETPKALVDLPDAVSAQVGEIKDNLMSHRA